MIHPRRNIQGSTRGRILPFAAGCCVVMVGAPALGQSNPNPPAQPAPERRVIHPRTSGPNTANLMPPTRRETRVRPIPNPVVRTNSFSMGLGYGYSGAWPCSWPYLMHTGGGHWIQYGYPFPIDVSYQNLQPGQLVQIPAPTWWRTQYEGYPLSETARRVDPAEADRAAAGPVQAPVPTQPVDEGREAMRAHDYERAIAIYERRHEEQESIERGTSSAPLIDRTAMRLLAVAHVGTEQVELAVGLLNRALADDPSLNAKPIDGRDLINSRREMRRLVNIAVKFAKARPSAESWELVAVLMEAEGRPEVAAKMRERGHEPTPAPAPGGAATRSAPAGPASFTMPLPGTN